MAIQVNIHGNNNGTIAETVVINNYPSSSQPQTHPAAQHAQEAEEVEEVQEVAMQDQAHQSILQTDSTDQQILDLLFRADDEDRGKTEILLSALIKGKKVKTKIVEDLYEHRKYFNLQNLSLEDKTKVMNAWIEKLGYSEQLNGKKFTIKDW